MRLPLLTSVSAIVLMALSFPAYAGFEFVPPPKPAPAAAAPAPEMTAPTAPIAAAPIAPVLEAPLLPPEGAISSPAPAMPSPVMRAPVTSTAPTTNEPMMIGKKAIPLTPVVKHSDALVMDDAPVAAPEPMAISPRPQAAPRAVNNALWDNRKPQAAMQMSDLPPPAMKSPAAIATSDLNDGPDVQGFGRQVPLAMALQQIVPASYRYSFDTGVDPGMRVTWNGGKPWKAVITDLARDNNLNVDIISNVVAFRRHVPMDIISAGSSVDTTSDTVQGMPLKPVPAFAANAPVIPTTPMDASMMTAMSEPMSILPSANEPALAPEITTTETITPAPSREPLVAITDKLEKAKVAQASTKTQPIFDNSFDDQPAASTVKEKKILLAENTSPAMPKPKALSPGAAANFDSVQPASSAPMISAQVKTTDVTPTVSPEVTTAAEVVTTTTAPSLPPIDNAPVMASAAPMPINPGMPAASVDMAASSDWEAYKNDTLRQVLTTWSERAGVSLVWSSEYDYPLQTDVRIQGGYNDAVRTLLAGFAKAQPRPLGRLFSNKAAGAKPVLVVETQRQTN